MTALPAKQVLQKSMARWDRRRPHEWTWTAIARAMRPLRDSFLDVTNGAEQGHRRLGADRYDGTASRASAGLASALYSELASPSNEWASIEMGDGQAPRDTAGREWIQLASSQLLRSFDMTNSAFYLEMYAVMLDMPTLGTAGIYSGRPGLRRSILDKALPLSEIAFDFGADNRVSHFDRMYWEPCWSIAQMFGIASLPEAIKKQIEQDPNSRRRILHATYPNPDHDPEAVWTTRAMGSVSQYIDVESGMEIHAGHTPKNHNYAGRWDLFSGSDYGRGLGELAMPAHGALDEMTRSAILHAQKSAEPSMAVPEDLAGIDFTPGANISGAIDDRGNMLVAPVNTIGSFAHAREIMNDQRQQIEDIFLTSLTTFASSPTPSVEEVLMRQDDRRTLTLPNMVRFMVEVLMPLVEDRFDALVRAGQIPPAPTSIAGAPLKIEFGSPILALARSQKGRSAMELTVAAERLAGFDPTIRHRIDAHQTLETVRVGIGAPLSMTRDDEQVAQIVAAERQASEQLEQLEQARLTAPAVESLARAEQAAAA